MILVLLAWQVSAAMPLLEQGRFAEARPVLEKACAAREANGCYLLGRTLHSLDRYDDALRVLQPLLVSDRDPWRVEDALGAVFEAQRNAAEAERHFQAAVRGNNERTPDPRYHYGRFLVREGRAADAIAVLTPCARKFPKYEAGRFELGRALYQINQFAAAETELTAAPTLEEARRLLAKLRRQREER